MIIKNEASLAPDVDVGTSTPLTPNRFVMVVSADVKNVDIAADGL